jgi:hypothetical protein
VENFDDVVDLKAFKSIILLCESISITISLEIDYLEAGIFGFLDRFHGLKVNFNLGLSRLYLEVVLVASLLDEFKLQILGFIG